MKKPLLIGAGLLLAAALPGQVSAQMATENFSSGIPTTWSKIKVDNNAASAGLGAALVAAFGADAWIALQLGSGNICASTVSWFDVPAKADRWLITPSFVVNDPNAVFVWDDGEALSGGTDSLQVWISTNAGTTVADFTQKLHEGPAGSAGMFVKHGINIGAYKGQTIRMAFRNNSYDGGISVVDNVGTTIPAVLLDAALESVTFENYVSKTSSTPVRISVSNQGAQVVNTLQITYTIDAGTPVSQTFTGLNLQPYAKTNLTFSAPIANPASGDHTLAVSIVQANGAADPVAANNNKSLPFHSADKSVQRNGLMEEFTSSTCPPCESFNKTFDPLVLSNNANKPGSNFNIIKYQQNYPQPGTDVSYNAQADLRHDYYSVPGIPDHATNGIQGGNGDQAEITASKAKPAFMDITNASFIMKGDSMIATATITPHFTMTGRNFKVHMASTEYYYDNTKAPGKGGGTTGQKDYYHVMRNMFRNGAGEAVNSWTSGTPQTFRWAHKWDVGTVTQGSNMYWNYPVGSASVVIFVQDETNKNVMQSLSTAAIWPAGVEKTNTGISQSAVYPNPATDHTSISFKLETGSNVDIQVTDALGRTVYNQPAQKLGAGNHNFVIPTSNFAAGLYTIKVQAENGMTTQRFSVVK